MTTFNKILIRKVAYAKTKQNSTYAALTLFDGKTNFNLAVWGCPEDSIKQHSLLTCSKVKDDDGFLSCKYQDIMLEEAGSHPLSRFIPRPTPLAEIHELIASAKPHLSEKYHNFLLTWVDKLYPIYNKFPGGRSNHHAYKGGLITHSFQLMKMAMALFNNTPFQFHLGQVLIACWFHDYGKISEYTSDFSLTESFFLQGHPYISASSLERFLLQSDFSIREAQLMSHIVLAHHGRLEWGSPVLPCTAEAFLVSHLDNLSGHGDPFNEASNMESNKMLKVNIIKSEL